jgi:hypothetical protein
MTISCMIVIENNPFACRRVFTCLRLPLKSLQQSVAVTTVKASSRWVAVLWCHVTYLHRSHEALHMTGIVAA